MATISIYTFTPAAPYNDFYEVFVDNVTLLVWCINDGSTMADELTTSDIGYDVGDLITSFCVGTTKYEVRADTVYPFAYLEPIADSPSCGYVAPVCDVSLDSVTKTDETEVSAYDGTATINKTLGTGPFEYSVDSLTWQPSNVFEGLAPGSYTAYVRDSLGCVDSLAFTIAAALDLPGAEVNLVYPWYDKTCAFFRLNGTLISEPIKWDNINVVGKRDREYHGWNYQFTDEVVDLEFDCDAGQDIINTEYNVKGSDGVVYLTYGYVSEGTEIVLFTGKLNLNTYKAYPQKVSCSVSRYDGNELLESRQDVKVSLAATTTLDGVALTPPPPRSFVLHGKEIKKKFQITSTTPISGNSITGSGGFMYTLPDSSAPVLAEIEDNYAYTILNTVVSPYADLKYQVKLKFEGAYTIRVKFSFIFQYLIPFVGAPATGSAQAILRINGTDTNIGSAVVGTVGGANFTLTVDQTETRNLSVNDEIYIYVKHTFSSAAAVIMLSQQSSNETTIDALEKAPDTNCKGWLIYETLNHVVKAITEKNSRLRSDFLRLKAPGETNDGQGALNMVTNGFQVRNYDITNKPLVISFKTILESLRAMFCIGVQYDDTRVRVERADFFYQDVEALFIPEVFDLTREAAKEMLYNEVGVGYDTYQEDGYNTLDEFNTQQDYITPIKTNKLKLNLQSKFITSGYSIETSRRQQFAQTATNSFQNDDNAFLVSVYRSGANYVPEKNEAFLSVTGVISPNTVYNLRHSPKRLLLNWAIWLKNIFHYKAGTEKLKNTFAVQNTTLSTQLLTGDVRPVGDINKQLLSETGELALSAYPVSRALFIPEWIKFKARVTPDKIQMLNAALKGKWDSTKNYGYVMYRDPIEGLVQGWVYELGYNFYTERAEFTLLRKA